MTWVAIVAIILVAWIGVKVVGAAFKLALWLVVLGLAYWVFAPDLGLPQLF